MKRLPEAIPVANADQSDTPGLGRLVQSRLYLLTHRTIYHMLHIISNIVLDIILYIVYGPPCTEPFAPPHSPHYVSYNTYHIISYIIYGPPCREPSAPPHSLHCRVIELAHRSPGCLVQEGEGRFLMQDSRPEQSLTLPRRKDLTPSLLN